MSATTRGSVHDVCEPNFGRSRRAMIPDAARDAEAVLTLPADLDLRTASALRAAILGRRGADLRVDASGVLHLGAQCLQVLIAARALWEADGHELEIESPSPPFAAALRLLGAAPGDIAHQVVA